MDLSFIKQGCTPRFGRQLARILMFFEYSGDSIAPASLLSLPLSSNSRKRMSESGHFRPIERGFAMSVYFPEADIGTTGIYEYTP
jgi:hypothetical protein